MGAVAHPPLPREDTAELLHEPFKGVARDLSNDQLHPCHSRATGLQKSRQSSAKVVPRTSVSTLESPHASHRAYRRRAKGSRARDAGGRSSLFRKPGNPSIADSNVPR